MEISYSMNLDDSFINKNDLLNAKDKIEFFKSKNLIPKIYEKDGCVYYIIQYNKKFILENEYIKKWRSVIFDSNFNLICYSPPKSENLELFLKSNSENNICYEEFVEGTMINLFYDKNINKWECATRSTIGANVKFYQNSSKTFREMFFETFDLYHIDYNDFDKNCCYSFILQHKENRIVVPNKENKIYLCECYEINGWNIIPQLNNTILSKYPLLRIKQIEKNLSQNEIINNYTGNGIANYQIMGLVIKNTSNHVRTKIRNPQYEMVRKLKGNQSKNQYNYICLRKQNNVKSYLQYYPEHKNEFYLYREQLHNSTKMLYKFYQECFIEKKNELKNYSSNYKTHMYKLHYEIYLIKLKPNNLSLKLKDVIEYVNNLHPSLCMNMINCK